MKPAETGDTVHIHYRGTLDDGSEFDSSHDRDPLRFTLGEPGIIPGFQDAVLGLKTGDSKRFKILAVDAYGEVRPDLVIQIARAEFPDHIDLEVGRVLEMEHEEGDHVRVVIVEADDEQVTLDGNHPLAGQDLTFEVELVAIV